MKIKSIVFVLFLAIKITPGIAQGQPKLDSYLKNIYAHHIIPGFSVMVIKNGNVFFSGGYGKEQIDSQKPFTTKSICSIGSITKSITAVAIMQLVQQNKIDLDQRVVHYIPWFKTANKDKSDKITVRMLLDNTSGLYSENIWYADNTNRDPMEELAKSLANIYLTREPGSTYTYSNVGFSLAGLLVSKISGLSYQEYVQKNIFKRLNMENSCIGTPSNKITQALTGHYYGIEKAILAEKENSDIKKALYAPAGSMTYSNAEDMGKYITSLMDDQDSRLLSKKNKIALWNKYTSFPGLTSEDGGDNSPFNYGLGWMRSTVEGQEIIHHGGSTGTTSSFIMIDPVKHISVCMLFNLDLSFIDKYSFPTEINIINNVRRLASGLQISKYGIPTGKNPFADHQLIHEHNDAYIGNYDLKQGGDDWVYHGVNLTVFRDKKGNLEGLIKRGKQIVNEFKINLINKSLGFSESTALPDQIKFKITPEGKVNGAFFKNMEFNRSNSLEKDYKVFMSTDKKVSFCMPISWTVKWQSGGLFSTDPSKTTLIYFSNQNKNNVKYINDHLFNVKEGYKSISLVQSHSENINDKEWIEKIYIFKKNNQIYQAFLLQTEYNGNEINLCIIANNKDFTSITQKVVFPLIKSLRLL